MDAAEADSFRQLDAALEAGLNFIDTADVYSRWIPGHTGGESETILGKWLAKGNKRSNVILATKLGLEMGEGKKGLSAAYIEQAVEASLRRLQTDYIDLYQAHRDDPETPLEETLAAFDKLVQAGQSTAHRRFELHRPTPGRSAPDQQRQRIGKLRFAAAPL